MNTIQLPLEARDKVVPPPVASNRVNDAAWSSLLTGHYHTKAMRRKLDKAAAKAAKAKAKAAPSPAPKAVVCPAVDANHLNMFEIDYSI